jgi:hypothetical protein
MHPRDFLLAPNSPGNPGSPRPHLHDLQADHKQSTPTSQTPTADQFDRPSLPSTNASGPQFGSGGSVGSGVGIVHHPLRLSPAYVDVHAALALATPGYPKISPSNSFETLNVRGCVNVNTPGNAKDDIAWVGVGEEAELWVGGAGLQGTRVAYRPTTVRYRFDGPVDHIWFTPYGAGGAPDVIAGENCASSSSLRLVAVLDLQEDLLMAEIKHSKLKGLPTRDYCSDHICLMARFVLGGR